MSILKNEYESKMKMIIDEVKENELNNELNQERQFKTRTESNIPTRSNSPNSNEVKKTCRSIQGTLIQQKQRIIINNVARSKQINEESKSKGVTVRGSKSPENIDKISLIANREKYKQYRELRKAPSNDYNANSEYRVKLLQTYDKGTSSQHSKVKCPNCGVRAKPEDYASHNSKCKVEHIYEMIDEEVEDNQSAEFLQNPMLFTSRRSSMEFGK